MSFKDRYVKKEDSEKEEIKKLYDLVESLQEQLKQLSGDLKKERSEKANKMSYSEAKSQIDQLFQKARNSVTFSRVGAGRTCPICNGLIGWCGCEAHAKFYEDRVVYGVRCMDKKKGGFYEQGELPIPKHLREFL